jgi:3-methyladenine DNA glycosylase AlkD
MESITSAAEVKRYVQQALGKGSNMSLETVVLELHVSVLMKKVKFPLLEAAGKEIYKLLRREEHINFADKVIDLHTIGGNVVASMLLQLHLHDDYSRAIEKAVDYIIMGNEWYVCDIIGERVIGHALLVMPEQTMPVLYKLSQHEDKWIVRCVGVAANYAIKKGLKKKYVDEVYQLLLSLSNTTDFHTKKGIGWAAKTTAKFHPEIIDKYSAAIDTANVKQWFKTKIKIGLGRTSKYAGRYTS